MSRHRNVRKLDYSEGWFHSVLSWCNFLCSQSMVQGMMIMGGPWMTKWPFPLALQVSSHARNVPCGGLCLGVLF